jgi:hypothetical protein
VSSCTSDVHTCRYQPSPERMLDGGFERLPPDSWKPFGNGMRGCIGRPFAWQESLLVVAMVNSSQTHTNDIRLTSAAVPELRLPSVQPQLRAGDQDFTHHQASQLLHARIRSGWSSSLDGTANATWPNRSRRSEGRHSRFDQLCGA